MKKLIATLALLTSMTSAFAYDAVLSTVEEVLNISVLSVMSPALGTQATSNIANEELHFKVEMEAVQDDARAFLAGDDMSENLREIISEAERRAEEHGLDELVDNPERIALEITML